MNLHIFLLLIVIQLARSIKHCPDQSVFYPCKCHVDGLSSSTVECNNFDSYDDLQKMFDNTLDYVFDTLILENCTVPYLNSSWFSTKKIETLYVERMSSIDLLNDENVDLTSVTTIKLEETRIMRGLRWHQFKPFSLLISLTVIDIEVRTLEEDFRDKVSSHLETLVVQSAQMMSLSDGVLKGKTKLSVIAFPYNRIKVLDKSMFEDQREVLVFLDFSYNPIGHVPENVFEGMNSLITIKLAGTHLRTLSKVLHLGGYLDVTDNPLVCNCKMSWIPDKNEKLEIDGSCESPPFLKSKLLKDLRGKDFIGCNNHLVAIVLRTVDFLRSNKLEIFVRLALKSFVQLIF